MGKGILDGLPVDDKTFPLKGRTGAINPTDYKKVIVGSCPKCGAPIYGNQVMLKEVPEVFYSCKCNPTREIDKLHDGVWNKEQGMQSEVK